MNMNGQIDSTSTMGHVQVALKCDAGVYYFTCPVGDEFNKMSASTIDPLSMLDMESSNVW